MLKRLVLGLLVCALGTNALANDKYKVDVDNKTLTTYTYQTKTVKAFECDRDSFDRHFKLTYLRYAYTETNGVKKYHTEKSRDELTIDSLHLTHKLFCEKS